MTTIIMQFLTQNNILHWKVLKKQLRNIGEKVWHSENGDLTHGTDDENDDEEAPAIRFT